MFTDIKEVLSKQVKKTGIAQEIQINEIKKIFKEAVKKFLSIESSKRIRAIYIKNKVLYAVSLSNAVTNQVLERQSEIITNINRNFSSDIILKIEILS